MTDATNLPATTVPRSVAKAQLHSGARVQALVPSTLEDAYRLGDMIYQSGVAPYQLKNPQSVSVVIMAGMELGLPPMQAMQSIMVVNNRPAIYGDAALALVRQSGLLAAIKESIEGEGEAMVARCIATRRNDDGSTETIEDTFSVADAKLAGLWTKRGKNGEATPWQTYPKRMLRFRARGFVLRDLFADVLKGMRTVEEAQDIDERHDAAPALDDIPDAPAATGVVEAKPAAQPRQNDGTAYAGTPIQEGNPVVREVQMAAVQGEPTPEDDGPTYETPEDELESYQDELRAAPGLPEMKAVAEAWKPFRQKWNEELRAAGTKVYWEMVAALSPPEEEDAPAPAQEKPAETSAPSLDDIPDALPEPEPAINPELLDAARMAAMNGAKKFRFWLGRRSTAEVEELRPQLESLRKAAELAGE